MLSKGVRPQNPAQYLRGSSRRCPGAGQDRGVQAIIPRQETCRNAVCALEAYPAARPAAIAWAMRCPVRVHVGSDCAEPPQACQVGRPATTNRPFMRCVSVASVSKVERQSPAQSRGWKATAAKNGISVPRRLYADFCNKIAAKQTARSVPSFVLEWSKLARPTRFERVTFAFRGQKCLRSTLVRLLGTSCNLA